MSNMTQFLPGAIKAIYRGEITVSGTATNTATITAVVTAKSVITHLGCRSSQAANTDNSATVALTNTTTVTAARVGTTGDVIVGYQVVEYV
jgi:hypothetical protein